MDNNLFSEVATYLKNAIKDSRFDGHVCLVGGCVRDSIMGREIHDFDVVVDLYNGGIVFATWLAMQDKNFVSTKNPIVYGQKQCALYKFNLNGKDISLECCQTRLKPVKIDITLPINLRDQNLGTFSSDAILRDATINSIYVNVSTGAIYDPNDGMGDIKKEMLRCPHEPSVIFKDDPLRMMRLIRFSSVLHFSIDKKTWLGIIENHELIKTVAVERIADEFNKILLSSEPSVGLKRLMASGLLFDIFPQMYEMNHIGDGYNIKIPYNVWENALYAVDCAEEKLPNRLASLFCQIGKTKKYKVTNHFIFNGFEKESENIATNILKQYKYSNDTIEKVCVAISCFNKFSGLAPNEEPKDKTIRKFISEAKPNLSLVMDVMKSFAFASNNTFLVEKYYKIEELVENFKDNSFVLPINGYEIMKKFSLRPGKKIGDILNVIKDKMFENPTMTKDEAFEIVQKNIK